MATLYALLVGINDYAPGIGTLDGCVNDVDHFRDYLSSSFDRRTLAIEVLKDSDATRDNIIRQFRTHLGRATATDTAVFLYCGHGARWAAAREFKEFYPDGKDEGLVCCDSRRQNGAYPFDLADKELAVLLAEVARGEPHLTVILDCCHSGSGTRDVDVFTRKARQTHEVLVERPLESYIDGYYVTRRDSGLPLSIPRCRHVLLAACDRHEKALERADRSGLFTSTLLAVASASDADLTYADLFVRCRMLIRSEAQNQTPQFEAFEQFNASSGFLGRSAGSGARPFKVHHDIGTWTLDAGAIHGVPTDRTASVALYSGADPSRSAGMATTIEVGLEKSIVELGFAGDPSLIYNGAITSFADPPMPVHFRGERSVRGLLEGALDADRSVRVALTDVAECAGYSLIAGDERWLLMHQKPELLIQGVHVTDPVPADAVTTMVRILKHVARWERGLALQNSRTRLDPSQLDCVFAERVEGVGEYLHAASEEIVVTYAKTDSGWKEVRGRFKVRNRLSQPVYAVLAYFSSSYGIHIFYNDRIDSGDEYVTLWGDAAEDYFWLEGETKPSAIEEFKLFVSTEPVDAFSIPQDDLALGRIVVPAADRAVGHVKPMQRLVHRNEWFTRPIRIAIIRQTAADRGSSGADSVSATLHPSQRKARTTDS